MIVGKEPHYQTKLADQMKNKQVKNRSKYDFRDYWYKCFFCKAPKQGKFNLSKHHYTVHLKELAAMMEMDVEEVKPLFSATIRNQNEKVNCKFCDKPFNRRYISKHEKQKCSERSDAV